MSIKYVVFDWDGTLADTYPVISAAYNHTFDTLGLPRIPYDEIKRITYTLQNKDTLAYIFGQHKQEAADIYYNFISKHHSVTLTPMPNANQVLEYCKKQNITTILISNKKTPYLIEEIEKLGFSDFFDKIIAAGEYAEDKPHPLTTHAAFEGQLPPADEILVLGDGEADFQTAASYTHGGKKAICVIYDPQNKYNGSKPDYKIENLQQVINIIEENCNFPHNQ